ncbi:MAG: ribokinase [Pseudomonadota bacterium]
MKILNFGSINIDHVYDVPWFVKPGETLTSTAYNTFAGGKGFNQSVALARAGANVFHAGKIGQDGAWLKQMLDDNGVNTDCIVTDETPTGHAIIQISPEGENSIILYSGANRVITDEEIAHSMATLQPGDWLLLQNEINGLPEILKQAVDKELTIVFNPAPMTPDIKDLPLHLVGMLVVNEIEGQALADSDDPDTILKTLHQRYPDCRIVLTLGGDGVLYADATSTLTQPIFEVPVEDTTGAGDTFTGYFVAALMAGESTKEALRDACRASSICVTRKGAADSIPHKAELKT